MNDAVQLACRHAMHSFGGPSDGLFNAAGFGKALMRIAGCSGGIDGNVVRAILCGRSDVEVMSGGAHFRLVEARP